MWIAQGRSHPEPADSSASATFLPRQRLGEDQEKKEEESPRVGSCRPLSRVAGSGPKSKVNYPLISALPSLIIYPRMCGHILEPDSRPGLRPVNATSAPTSGGRSNKGPADGYPLPKPQKRPHPGLAEGSKQPKKLQRRPSPPREWPHQVGLAEVLLRRVQNLLGLRSSVAFMYLIAFLTRVPDSRS